MAPTISSSSQSPLFQITEERRRVPQIVKEKAFSSLASENSYLDKFVRNIQHEIDSMLQESREIDSIIISRTTSINRWDFLRYW